MPAYTKEGAATRQRVVRALGPLAKLAPDGVLDDTDWDAMARGSGVPWDEEKICSRMSAAEFNAIWDDFREQQRAELIGGTLLEVDREERELAERTERAHVPDRYRNAPLDLTHIADLQARRGAYVYGRQGSGKTWLACAMLRGWLSRNGGRALFVTSVGLLTEITATYSDATTVLEVVDRYGRCPLLVIDDLGKENPTPHALQMLWHVLNTRYEWDVPTIITSQYRLSELGQRLSSKGDDETAASIISRIRETCVHVDTGDIDMRLSGSGTGR